jgi:hypothetical protein
MVGPPSEFTASGYVEHRLSRIQTQLRCWRCNHSKARDTTGGAGLA